MKVSDLAIQKKEDQELVALAQEGNFGAFDTLVNRHEKRLYSHAMRILQNREDAEDVMQSTFIKAMEHLPQFRGEASFSTWVTRIASNTALNVLRKRNGLESVSLNEIVEENEEGFIPHPEVIADWRGDPSKIVEQRELQEILDEAISNLPEKQRLVFILRDVIGMSISETRDALGISAANVKVRLLRARLALRERLTYRFEDPQKRHLKTHSHDGDEEKSTSAKILFQSYLTG
ncbi:MAG: sigma-70 family RNA polymerase sigma factor [Nitrospirae bacterium]|nr:sigma-70 family RNA polymerase sigma factor [Candidatus Manganitrophaceae bacterium]